MPSLGTFEAMKFNTLIGPTRTHSPSLLLGFALLAGEVLLAEAARVAAAAAVAGVVGGVPEPDSLREEVLSVMLLRERRASAFSSCGTIAMESDGNSRSQWHFSGQSCSNDEECVRAKDNGALARKHTHT